MRSIVVLTFLLAAPALAQPLKLPLVEVPAVRGTSDTLVIFVSGDGGWAAIDKSIAHVLAENGMPVAGLNALQYFWTKRTPDAAARDLERIAEHYLATWKKSRIVLVGYSRGADVLPSMVNRLPAPLRSRIRLLALLGPSPRVEFEFHVSDWMHNSARGEPVKPELDKVTTEPILCVSGEDDRDSLCSLLTPSPRLAIVTLKGAHHFDGNYERLGRIILDHLR